MGYENQIKFKNLLIKQYTPDYKVHKNLKLKRQRHIICHFNPWNQDDFKYVIFKIVEVSPWNPPAKQHSRFGPHWVESGQIGCAA